MPKHDPIKLALKGSKLSPATVSKLALKSISNPDAPGFGSKPEPMTLVRHLMWAVRQSQKKDNLRGSALRIASIAEVLQLTHTEVEEIITLLQNTIGTSFSRIYS